MIEGRLWILIDAKDRVVKVVPCGVLDARVWRVVLEGGQVIPMTDRDAEKITRGMYVDCASWQTSTGLTRVLLGPLGQLRHSRFERECIADIRERLEAGGAVLRVPRIYVEAQGKTHFDLPKRHHWRVRTWAQVKRGRALSSLDRPPKVAA